MKSSAIDVIHQKLKYYESFLGDKFWLTGDDVSLNFSPLLLVFFCLFSIKFI